MSSRAFLMRWRFRLRILLVFVGLLCVAIVPVAWRLEANRRARAVTHNFGAVVHRDPKPPTVTHLPETIARDVWPHVPDSVVEIENNNNRIFQDADLDEIGLLKHLRVLRVPGSPITDQGVRKLCHLTELTELDIHGTEITDDALRSVGSLVSLEYLRVSETSVTDAGVAHLVSLKKLRLLLLQQTMVTDHVIETLARIPSLKRVKLEDTAVTPAGIRRLKSLSPKVIASPFLEDDLDH